MKYIFLICSICVFCTSCYKRKDETFFKVGELSEEPFNDSVASQIYSSELRKFKEGPLRKPLASYSLRLSVFSSFHDSYCIRIDQLDSSVLVTFKVLGDGPSFRPSGLKNLSMVYESDHARMDSLFFELRTMAEKYFSKEPKEEPPGLDGIVYLLECNDNGMFRVVRGLGGGDDLSVDSLRNDSLLDLAFKIQSFVPKYLLPSADDLSKEEWFSPLQKDTLNAVR